MKAPLPFALLVVVAPALAAQSRASRLIDSAFAQAQAGRMDSAAALVGPVLDASIPSKPEEHASALVVYGVVEFCRGRDSAAARAFHEALESPHRDFSDQGKHYVEKARVRACADRRAPGPGVRGGTSRLQAAVVRMTRLGLEPRTYG